MAQLHLDATVTDGSANVTLPGDVRAEITPGDYFKLVGIAGVYEIGAISLLGTDTQIQLTAPFLGESGNYPALIHRDFSPEQGYPLIYAGDLDIPDLLRRWALQADSAPAAAVAAHVSAADPHPQYTTAAEAAAAAPVQSVVGRTGEVTAQQVADAVDALLPLAQLHVGKPTADPATPITGSLLSGAMLAAGALVEQGQNANGSYWRWESGLQVCTRAFYSLAGNTADNPLQITFPAVFITAPALGTSMFRGDFDSAHAENKIMNGIPGAAGFPQAHTASVHAAIYASYIAIGRWK